MTKQNADVILMGLACACFFLAAIGWPKGPVNLVALGLFFWTLTLVIK